MLAAVGHSHDLDSADAIEEALDACREKLGGMTPQAGLLFAGIDHDHQALLDRVEARYPGLQLIGCTTHGELSSAGFSEDSVVLMLFHSERVQFRAAVGEDMRKEPAVARQAVAKALDGLGVPVRLCIALAEGVGDVDSPGTIPLGLLDALGDALGPEVLVCGGLAADQVRFSGTYQFCNGRVYTDALPILLMAGPLRVATGVASGWQPIGEEHRLTDVDGLLVGGINAEPPRDVWRRYFGMDNHSGAPNFFAVYPESGEQGASDGFYLCCPARFQEDGSMVTMTPAAPGARIRFTSATREQLLAGARSSAEKASASLSGGDASAAVVFSCASRHALLGTRVGEETRLVQEQVGASVPVIGFYTMGEICSPEGSANPVHHVSTFVTVLIGEES